MDAVIGDLDKDLATEIATGVSYLNIAVEQIKDDLRSPKGGWQLIQH
jgi:hypothetical protein